MLLFTCQQPLTSETHNMIDATYPEIIAWVFGTVWFLGFMGLLIAVVTTHAHGGY